MPKRRAIWITLLILLLYPTSYLVVSRNGNYSLSSTSSSRIVIVVEPDRHYIDRWRAFPTHSGMSVGHQNALYRFYRPLVFLDRRYFHPDRDILLPEPNKDLGIPPIPFPIAPPSDTLEANIFPKHQDSNTSPAPDTAVTLWNPSSL